MNTTYKDRFPAAFEEQTNCLLISVGFVGGVQIENP